MRDSNDNAFVKTETRTGPPLDYITDKLRGSLERLHILIRHIDEHVPDGLPNPYANHDPDYSVKQHSLLRWASHAFTNAMVAYLALNNMLALANDDPHFDRLLGMSYEDFRSWLDRIDQEGCVN